LSFLRPFKKANAGPILRSETVLLRPPEMDDYEEWIALRKASRKFLEPWEPEWQDDELTRTGFRYRLHVYNKLSQEERSQALFIFATKTSALLGAINLNNIRRGVAQTATLGYWIGEHYTRKGYMSAAMQSLIAYALGDMGLHRLEAACLPSNQASIALLKRSGFEQEGYAKSYLKIAGQWQDHLLFAKLKT
jgi:[ribosomal protein S5]-alanine N-acetyltransferase